MPRVGGEKIGAWYARCPIRPIVFEDPGVLHLGELLGANRESAANRFTCIWSTGSVSGFWAGSCPRASCTRTFASLSRPDERLAAPGLSDRAALPLRPSGHALHEDVIAVCAEWIPPESRRGPLKPIDPKQLGEEEFMRRLDDALLVGRHQPDHRHQAPGTAGLGRSGCPRASGPSEEARRRSRDHDPQGAGAAGEKEAENTRKLLEDQDKRIDKTLERFSVKRPARTKAKAAGSQGGTDPFDTEEPPEPLYDERARRERAAEKRAMEKRKEESSAKSWKSPTEFAAIRRADRAAGTRRDRLSLARDGLIMARRRASSTVTDNPSPVRSARQRGQGPDALHP